MFEIWKGRNDLEFDEVFTNYQGIIGHIWHQTRVYLKVEWDKRVAVVQTGKLTMEISRKASIYRDFGGNGSLYTIEGLKLIVAMAIPSRIC